jgi:acetolactate synthase-1/2/3 large subunit
MAIDIHDWMRRFSEKLTKDDTVVCDAGGAYYLCHQELRMPEGCRLITDLAQGAMGFAIPAAIGAAMVNKKGMVYVITGDGSYNFMLQNTLTVYSEKIKNIETIVIDNDGYKTIRDSQGTWCEGREIGTRNYEPIVSFLGTATTIHCPDYEVRRPVIA